MQAAQITKGPRETHKAYVLRKCRAAAKQGLRLWVSPGILGSADIYGYDGATSAVLLACVGSTDEGRAIINRISN